MSATALVVTIIVIVAVVIIAFLALQFMRRRRLQHRFGPEYDRAVETQPNRAAAEHELRAREQRHAELDLRELTADEQQRYVQEWLRIQGGFVDDPRASVGAADALITKVMRDRGYPTGDLKERVDTLSVEHSRRLDHYRTAHEVSVANERGEASTEQLRQAIVHYRALASDLLGPAAEQGRHAAGTGIEERERT